MKLVIVAGFYNSVNSEIKRRFPEHKSIVYIPQIADGREADARRFKAVFFDQLARGAKTITVLLAVFRGRGYIKERQ